MEGETGMVDHRAYNSRRSSSTKNASRNRIGGCDIVHDSWEFGRHAVSQFLRRGKHRVALEVDEVVSSTSLSRALFVGEALIHHDLIRRRITSPNVHCDIYFG